MKFTAKDDASDYESLSKSNYFTDIVAALKDYREKLAKLESNSSDCIITTVKVPKNRGGEIDN
ncbi:MAG: hypothetical protein K2G83_02265 [Ruminococcus sp.]|nr:hypothetical protein [Ruminococcus sp.]